MMTQKQLLTTFWRYFLALFCVYLHAVKAAAEQQNGHHHPIRWASSGGGWRAMFSDFAFANVFAQAGLFDSSSSKIQAVSAESGGAWHTVQFFHSEQYYEKAVTASSSDVYDFVISWMNAYKDLTSSIPESDPLCTALDKLGNNSPILKELAETCFVLTAYDGDWALFIHDMLNWTATSYGTFHFADKEVKPETRNEALKNTEEYLQTSMSPSARVRNSDTGVFFGPPRDTSPREVYSTPRCVQYSVTNDETLYFTNMLDSNNNNNHQLDDLTVHTKTIPNDFRFEEWDNYPYFEGANGTGTSLIRKPLLSRYVGTAKAPFAGLHATVAQIASASSAAVGKFTGLIPSVMAQLYSTYLYDLELKEDWAEIAALIGVVDLIYNTPMLDDLSVCSQWPGNCTDESFRFIDGTYTDDATLALNIAQFQARQEYDDENTMLKVFVTSDQTTLSGAEPNILSYFNSSYNSNGKIAPGDYLWHDSSDWSLPYQSHQIFEEHLDVDALHLEPLSAKGGGSNITTVVLHGTTTDNSVFKVAAGLSVEIFWIHTNSSIPTVIMGESTIEEYTVPLAELAHEIASSAELVERVKAFVTTDYHK